MVVQYNIHVLIHGTVIAINMIFKYMKKRLWRHSQTSLYRNNGNAMWFSRSRT
jgi:hypothetical protein